MWSQLDVQNHIRIYSTTCCVGQNRSTFRDSGSKSAVKIFISIPHFGFDKYLKTSKIMKLRVNHASGLAVRYSLISSLSSLCNTNKEPWYIWYIILLIDPGKPVNFPCRFRLRKLWFVTYATEMILNIPEQYGSRLNSFEYSNFLNTCKQII